MVYSQGKSRASKNILLSKHVYNGIQNSADLAYKPRRIYSQPKQYLHPSISARELAGFAPCRPPAQRAPGAVRLTIFPGRAHGAEESDWTAVLGDEV